MKEVMFYLGQYIFQKQLYDQKQQHIIHCSQDALGRVLGVDSFSVKDTQVLFPMITKNLVLIKSQDSPPSPIEPQSETQTDKGAESGRSEITVAASDPESDNFSVEFEVDSDDYSEDEASLMSTDDEVYEVTIFEAEDNDSFDEDTEIGEADYWRCVKCDELNPPLPGKCLRCWTLSEASLHPKSQQNTPDSQPSSSSIDSQELLPSSRNTPSTLVLLLESLIWRAVFLQNGVFPTPVWIRV
ncbi:hypothetical protein F7725_028591 [Dissostichus mawsoni]|uniref:DM2 domain-containing protein n=1 Tax=Dissostichus mawsoni TaxID=36200 RepID=A0A7J5XGR8_DISMA|nr:hypothetical protein F7725_028591 [Dissostichus mawsoni]